MVCTSKRFLSTKNVEKDVEPEKVEPDEQLPVTAADIIPTNTIETPVHASTPPPVRIVYLKR